MLVDLVQITTRDGFRLDGAYLAPAGPKALPLDAVEPVPFTPFES